MKLVHAKQIKNPRRVTAYIEAETWKKLQHLRIDRGAEAGHRRGGLSVLVEEALQAWLPGEEQKGPARRRTRGPKVQDPMRVTVRIEDETYTRLHHAAIDRNYSRVAMSILIQEALEKLFLEEEKKGKMGR